VCDDEQARIPEGSEFKTEGAATLKPWEAKAVQTRGAVSFIFTTRIYAININKQYLGVGVVVKPNNCMCPFRLRLSPGILSQWVCLCISAHLNIQRFFSWTRYKHCICRNNWVL